MFGVMSNLDGDLFDELKRWEREMGTVFGGGPWPNSIRSVERGTYPPINVGGTPERVEVYVFAAGVAPSDLEISIHKNLLTIKGERRLITEAGADYYRKERFDGSFHRVVTLPEDVDPERVEARYRDGVLHISIRRRESSRPRQVEIK